MIERVPMVWVVRLVLRLWLESGLCRLKFICVLVCILELRRVGIGDMSKWSSKNSENWCGY